MRKLMILGALAAPVLAGCGGTASEQAAAPQAAAKPAVRKAAAKPAVRKAAAKPKLAARHGRKLIVFRRVRYEGATLNVMTLYADGFVTIDVPNGGAGGAKFVSRAKPSALRGARRAIATTPWRNLSKRRVFFDHSGAYFMLHHKGKDHIAMASGMSADLKPVVTWLNAILTGDGRGKRRTVHRWGAI